MVSGRVEIGGDEVEGVGILRCGDEWDKSSSSLENPERRRGQRDGFVGGIAGVVGEVGVPLGEHLERGGGIPWASARGGCLGLGRSRGEEFGGKALVGAEEHGVDILGDSGPGDADPLAISMGEAFSKWQKTGTVNESASLMVMSRGPLHRVPLHGRCRVQRRCLRSFTL